MPNNGYFDSERDGELIKGGGYFWCSTCLVARPLDDLSPDPRYCQGCYGFLLKEVEMLSSGKHPQWVPRTSPKPIRQLVQPSSGGCHNYTHTPLGSPMESGIMATVKGKRGPKRRADLPAEMIMQWASEGMGSKMIASKLKAELNITIGFRTVARIIAGQRVLV